MDTGRMPPQAVELEEAVLGALMLESEYYPILKEFVRPEHFYKNSHQIIYRAIDYIGKKGSKVDILTVTQHLMDTKQLDKMGGAWYITQLTNRVASGANCELHARIVYQKYLQREMIRISSEMCEEAYEAETDTIHLLESGIKQFRELYGRITDEGGGGDDIDKIIDRTMALMETAKANKGVLGYPIGIKSVDTLLNGLQPGTVTVIAARPGMGKSAMVKTIFVNLAKQRIKVKIFSLEVKAEKFMMNIISDILETNNQDVFAGRLTEEQKHKLKGLLEEVKSYMDIDDKPGIYISYLEKKVKKAVAEGCKVVMIDYLQLMRVAKTDANPTNREQVVSFLTREIKRIAAECDIPIIELSQLNREVDTRKGDKRPQLSDLRESGSIEQDAETVIFLYRPEYYGIKSDKKGNDLTNAAEAIFAKNRNGPPEKALMRFTPHLTKFEDYYIPESTPGIMGDDNQKVYTNTSPGEEPAF